MLFDFLLQLTNKFIKLIFSYVSWQSHEVFLNPITSITLTFTIIYFFLSVFF